MLSFETTIVLEEFIANPKNIQPVYNKVSPPALYEEITQALQIAIE